MKEAAYRGGLFFHNSICFPVLPGLPSVREDRRVQQGLGVQLAQSFRARHLFRLVRVVPRDLQNILQA